MQPEQVRLACRKAASRAMAGATCPARIRSGRNRSGSRSCCQPDDGAPGGRLGLCQRACSRRPRLAQAIHLRVSRCFRTSPDGRNLSDLPLSEQGWRERPARVVVQHGSRYHYPRPVPHHGEGRLDVRRPAPCGRRCRPIWRAAIAAERHYPVGLRRQFRSRRSPRRRRPEESPRDD